MMESTKSDKVKIRCPECAKYIYGLTKKDGAIACTCPHCKVIVYSKEHKGKDKLIKIKYSNIS